MKLNLQFSANTNCDDVLIEIYLNNNKIFQSTAQQQLQQILCEIDEFPAEHELKLVMLGKNQSCPVVNDSEEIVSDIYFKINQLEFEDIDMQEVFCLGKKCYTHHGDTELPHEFYGILGHNGTVKINFATPIYLWLKDYF
jgi:hypothetical protein